MANKIKYLHGLDLSLSRTGIVVFNLKTSEPELITSVHTSSKKETPQRLYRIANKIIEIQEKYPPSIAIIERGFTMHNTATQMLYRVHGIANYLYHDIEQVYYPPTTIKATIIHGKASKKHLQQKIKKEYNVKFKNEDESDAFAIALTHLIKTKQIKWEKGL